MINIKSIFNWYFSKSALPYWCILLLDAVIVYASGFIAYYLFNGGDAVVSNFHPLSRILLLYVTISMVTFRLFHTYSGIIRYSSFADLKNVAFANVLGLVLALGAHYFIELPKWPAFESAPFFANISARAILLLYIMATILMWGLRVLVKTLFEITSRDSSALPVLIYGAMSGGVGLAKFIRTQNPPLFILRGFISHDRKIGHSMLMREPVFTLNDDLREIIRKRRIRGLIVSPSRIKDFQNEPEFQDMLIAEGIKIYMSYGAQEWNGNSVDYAQVQLREVSIEDLLPRDEIKISLDEVEKMLRGKRVLITGSAGSIGSEMVRQVAKFGPAAMMLIDQAETPQHDIRLMMKRDWPDIPAETVVTSITDRDRMEHIFAGFRPEYVFHAAAYKHVPMMEDNPSEAVYNNIYGTKVIADLSVKYGVRKFVMVSTDKAVNPTNVMGCSKRICEIYVQSLNKQASPQQAYPQPLPEGKGVASPQPSPKGEGVAPTHSLHTADKAWYGMLKKFAEENRKKPTEAESVLWQALRGKGLGEKFRRQHILDDFIVDFICLEKELIIEVDGGYHNYPPQMKMDAARTEALTKMGYTELRFTNEEVLCDIDNVLSKISSVLKSQPSGGDLEGASEGACQFVTTRFGNVLGSNGSVIPLFREQLKRGGPLTVTHPDIIRYFMLIPEACKLVLEAGTMGKGGEIFVFDMGKPVKIIDLARRMIALSGAQNVEIKITGLRDGEKLYEEVLNEQEHVKPTFHEKIKIADVREYEYAEANREIEELIAIARQYDDMATVRKMKQIVPEYKSNKSKYEVLDKEKTL